MTAAFAFLFGLFHFVFLSRIEAIETGIGSIGLSTTAGFACVFERIAPALVCAVSLAVMTFLVMMVYHMPQPAPPAVLAISRPHSFDVYLAAWNAFQPRAYVMALGAGAAAFAICYRSARPRVVVGRVLDICGGLSCALPIAIPLSDFGPSARVAGTISYLDVPQVYGPVAFAAVVAAIVFFLVARDCYAGAGRFSGPVLRVLRKSFSIWFRLGRHVARASAKSLGRTRLRPWVSRALGFLLGSVTFLITELLYVLILLVLVRATFSAA